MLPYNVPNDRTLGPSAGRVQNKQQVARADVHFLQTSVVSSTYR